jgi:hypothetical protein
VDGERRLEESQQSAWACPQSCEASHLQQISIARVGVQPCPSKDLSSARFAARRSSATSATGFETAGLPRRSPAGEAISYVPNNGEDLARFLLDGRIELDSNSDECSMRVIAWAGTHCSPAAMKRQRQGRA